MPMKQNFFRNVRVVEESAPHSARCSWGNCGKRIGKGEKRVVVYRGNKLRPSATFCSHDCQQEKEAAKFQAARGI